MNQLALPLALEDSAHFDTYLPAGNETAVSFLERLCRDASGPGMWLTGGAATGKSHLLQAVCRQAEGTAVYLPLADLAREHPGLLEGMAQYRFLCLDDPDMVSGHEAWERALFNLYNEARALSGVIIVASRFSARDGGIRLKDLQSRFSELPAFRLSALDDEELKAALRLRARHRGLDLPAATADFLLTRERRDMRNLYRVLDRLDSEALAAGRRLTVPFVRSVLGEE